MVGRPFLNVFIEFFTGMVHGAFKVYYLFIAVSINTTDQ